MILHVILISLLITMMGGKRELKNTAPAPIVISHAIGNQSFNKTKNESDFAIQVYQVPRQGIFLVDLPGKSEPTFIQPKDKETQKNTAQEISRSHQDRLSWLDFLEVRSVQIFPPMGSKNLYLTLIRHCSGSCKNRISWNF